MFLNVKYNIIALGEVGDKGFFRSEISRREGNRKETVSERQEGRVNVRMMMEG